MSIQSAKKKTNLTKSAPRRFRTHLGALLLIPALMFSVFFITIVRAGTLFLTDPQPQNSTTLFGYSVAVVGDIDGDGVPDLAVGARSQDGDFGGATGFGTPQNVGKVFIVSGKTLSNLPTRVLNDPEFQQNNSTFPDSKFGGQFGTSVAVVGDINNDGFADILVGVPHHNPNKAIINAGRAFVFSGKDGTLLFTLDDPKPQEAGRFGFAVAGLGDVNSDGVPDLLVGVPGKDTTGVPDSQVGIAYIFSGKDGTLIRSLNYPSPGAADAGANFGAAVANAGSIGSVASNVLIGAPRRSRAFVFNGSTGALLFTLVPPTSEGLPSFGSAVAAGKDLNGDGKSDFAVGAPLRDSLHGKVFIFNGSDGSLQQTIDSPVPQASARFGASIILTDDVTGDGKPDILVGAPDQNVNGLLDAGEAFILNGATGALFKSITSTAPQAFAGFGSSLAVDPALGTVIGAPFQNMDLVNSHGDLQTHLQIGQIELQ